MADVTGWDECRRVVEKRVQESDLSSKRVFHRVKAGTKRSVGHKDASKRAEEVPGYGNYGVHAAEDDTLVLIDIDDYNDGVDTDALESARERLPETLTFSTAHDGECLVFHVPRDGAGLLPAERLEEEFGAQNVSEASFGEVRVSNQYSVGAGSQLDGCSKDWCDNCEKEDGGWYTVLNDAPIATLNADLLCQILAKDRDVTRVREEAGSDDTGGSSVRTARRQSDGDSDAYKALDALDCRDVAEETIVGRWNDSHGSGENVDPFYPTWGPNCAGRANVVGADGWKDTGGRGKGGPIEMAAIACDELDYDERVVPGDVSGSDWKTAYNYLRSIGDNQFNLPELTSSR
ncbi:bifunctional DNA primase/polymerase, partial [Halogeometricum luteum]